MDTIAPYFNWCEKFYTRNLIHKDERFHADCWAGVSGVPLRPAYLAFIASSSNSGRLQAPQVQGFDVSLRMMLQITVDEAARHLQ